MLHIFILAVELLLNQYLAATTEQQGDDIVDLSSLLPFSIQPGVRWLTIQEAISEGIYRQKAQLDFHWGDRSKYGLYHRSSCRRNRTGDSEGSDSAGTESGSDN